MYDSKTPYLYWLQWHPNQEWIILIAIEPNNPQTTIKSVIFKTDYVHKYYPIYEMAKEILNNSEEKFVTLDTIEQNISHDMQQPDMLIRLWLKKVLKK